MSTKPDYDKLYEIAEGQAGYFTTSQAAGAGFSRERLSGNVNAGRFLRVDHGIYRLAQFPASAHEDLYIAWLRAGPESAISHESALAVYELSDAMPSEAHVTVSRTASRRRKNIRQHTKELDKDEVTSRAGLLITTVARTIADVAATGLAEELVRQAIEEALQRGMVSEKGLVNYAEVRGGRFRKILYKVNDKGGAS